MPVNWSIFEAVEQLWWSTIGWGLCEDAGIRDVPDWFELHPYPQIFTALSRSPGWGALQSPWDGSRGQLSRRSGCFMPGFIAS